jgi:hypothetical protein
MSVGLSLVLLFAPAVAVDEWVPYTDGRPGGCYRSASGLIYGCTPPPRTASEPDVTPVDTAAELREVRRELEALKLRQAAEDARRAREEAERRATDRAQRQSEQRDYDAAMEAYNAIEAAKDSQRLRELGEKTEVCRKALEARGYQIVGPGACRAPDASYVNCPDC